MQNFKNKFNLKFKANDFLLMLCTILLLCSFIKYNQGIEGQVILKKQYDMPLKPRAGFREIKEQKKPYLKAKIIIYTKTNAVDAVQLENNPTYFTKINGQLIAEIETDTLGYFKIELPPGEYSVFIKEKNYLYCNSFSYDKNADQTFLNPIIVDSNKFTFVNVQWTKSIETNIKKAYSPSH